MTKKIAAVVAAFGLFAALAGPAAAHDRLNPNERTYRYASPAAACADGVQRACDFITIEYCDNPRAPEANHTRSRYRR